MSRTVEMPVEPPAELAKVPRFDEELFDCCRNDDYAGIYRIFVRRYGKPSGDPK
jgi:hypothetical protein